MATQKKAPTRIRSAGQKAIIAALEHRTLREVSALLGVSHVTVRTYATGEATPRAPQQRLAEEHLGIRRAAWTQPATGSEPPPPEPPAGPRMARRPPEPREPEPAASGDVGTSLEVARAHLLRVQASRQQAEAEGIADEVRKWSALEAKAIEQVAKLRGDLSPADESRLTQTPRWLALRAAIIDALRPYPDAREAVIARLREMAS